MDEAHTLPNGLDHVRVSIDHGTSKKTVIKKLQKLLPSTIETLRLGVNSLLKAFLEMTADLAGSKQDDLPRLRYIGLAYGQDGYGLIDDIRNNLNKAEVAYEYLGPLLPFASVDTV